MYFSSSDVPSKAWRSYTIPFWGTFQCLSLSHTSACDAEKSDLAVCVMRCQHWVHFASSSFTIRGCWYRVGWVEWLIRVTPRGHSGWMLWWSSDRHYGGVPGSSSSYLKCLERRVNGCGLGRINVKLTKNITCYIKSECAFLSFFAFFAFKYPFLRSHNVHVTP